MRRIACLLIACLTLGACDPVAGARGENRAPGVARTGASEDALIVGHRLMEAGEFELALKAYLRAAAEHGINSDTLSAIGSANLALGRLGQAEKALRRALELEPEFVPALNNLGVVLMDTGRIGEARATFQQAFALDSGQTDAIRENLKRAIAESEGAVYDEPEEKPTYKLVRRQRGEFVLLSQL